MTPEQIHWDDLRRIADEIELHIHLGSMDARDRWHELEPKLVELEHRVANTGIGAVIDREITELHAALVRLRDDLVLRARGDYVTGW
ncbi:MAG TPA: hypothetical protein VLB44_00375 [Kofleriaceae bacterium]|nr:hypothetical protein [Kofleriaceae bacterium]